MSRRARHERVTPRVRVIGRLQAVAGVLKFGVVQLRNVMDMTPLATLPGFNPKRMELMICQMESFAEALYGIVDWLEWPERHDAAIPADGVPAWPKLPMELTPKE